MTRRYHKQVGGTLYEEFLVVRQNLPEVSKRLVDAVIIVGGKEEIVTKWEYKDDMFAGRDLIVVQTKAKRLSMTLLGQALFSRLLIAERFPPKSVRSVAVCTADDAALRPHAQGLGIEIVVYPPP